MERAPHFPQTNVRSICLNSSDAVEVSRDGDHVFDLQCLDANAQVARVSLATIELPASQYTIEHDTNRMHFCEGLRFGPGYREIHMRAQLSTNQVHEQNIKFPVYLNAIRAVRRLGAPKGFEGFQCFKGFDIETVFPHGLESISRCEDQVTAWWVCSRLGAIKLHFAPEAPPPVGNAARISEIKNTHTFRVSLPPTAEGVSAPKPGESLGFLHMPTIGGPAQWAKLLQCALRGSGRQPLSYEVSFDAVNGALSVVATGPATSVGVSGDNLAVAWGLHGAVGQLPQNAQTASSSRLNDMLGDPTPSSSSRAPVQGGERYHLTGRRMLTGWPSVALSPGWYGPSSRPWSVSPTRQLAPELTRRWNLLRFDLHPIEAVMPEGCVTPYVLPFTDPSGVQTSVPVYCGIYSSTSLCDYLSIAMTRACSNGAKVKVSYTDERFVFDFDPDGVNSASTQGGFAQPSLASLDFDFKLAAALDPERFGFARARYTGRSKYASEQIVVVPDAEVPDGDGGMQQRAPQGHYCVTDVPEQRRFRFDVHRRPELWCSTCDAKTLQTTQRNSFVLKTSRPRLSTSSESISMIPFAHGYTAGDLVHVRLTRVEAVTSTAACADTKCRVGGGGSVLWEGLCAVPTKHHDDADAFHDDPCMLELAVPGDLSAVHASALRVHQDTLLVKVSSVDTPTPSLHLTESEKACIPRRSLGFTDFAWSPSIIAWNEDNQWPILSPSSHRLDHPDYILVYLDVPGKPTTGTLQRACADGRRYPLAKVIVSPQVRDGAVRCEVSSTISIRRGRFTIRLRNPDGTPYRLHGASYSLTLSLVGDA